MTITEIDTDALERMIRERDAARANLEEAHDLLGAAGIRADTTPGRVRLVIADRDTLRNQVAELRESLRHVLECSDLRNHRDASAADCSGIRILVDLYALVMAKSALATEPK